MLEAGTTGIREDAGICTPGKRGSATAPCKHSGFSPPAPLEGLAVACKGCGVCSTVHVATRCLPLRPGGCNGSSAAAGGAAPSPGSAAAGGSGKQRRGARPLPPGCSMAGPRLLRAGEQPPGAAPMCPVPSACSLGSPCTQPLCLGTNAGGRTPGLAAVAPGGAQGCQADRSLQSGVSEQLGLGAARACF